MKKHILIVFGTRPEAIKMMPVVMALRQSEDFTTTCVVTAQHREQLDHVLRLFDVAPDIDLNIMMQSQDLTDITCMVLTGLRDVLARLKPDMLLVHGDTTTAMAASMAGFFAGVPVAHVEAGLRTWDKQAPFPEEANRVVISHLAQLHFAPTTTARNNLLREAVAPESILLTGNTVIDALLWMGQRMGDQVPAELAGILGQSTAAVPRFLLVTAHRRESFGAPFEGICRALRRIAAAFPDTRIIYPVHLNPNIRDPAYRLLGGIGNIHLIDPVDYAVMAWLLRHCVLVLTDSGGLQEEAPSFHKPVLVLREKSERLEAVEAGLVAVVGTAEEAIVAHTQRLLTDPAAYAAMATGANPFGDGQAARRIVEALRARL